MDRSEEYGCSVIDSMQDSQTSLFDLSETENQKHWVVFVIF